MTKRLVVTFGFWNVNSRSSTDERGISELAANFALENALEILFLIECAIPYEKLIRAFKEERRCSPIVCGDRFKVIARFDQRFMKRLEIPIPSDRFDIWHLTLPFQVDLMLALVHGLDKRNNSPAKQELLMQQLVGALSFCETAIGHNRSVVFGDFNANPFESPIAGATGLHAVVSKTIAQSQPRTMFDKEYPYFYNPMWNLYGDEPESSAPATYYYRGSDPHELYWHMLDQVLIRPSLLNRFDFSSLRIVTTLNGTKLISKTGYPDQVRFSDHLPVVFELNLSETSEE